MSPDEAGHGQACTELGEKFIAGWRDTGGSEPANTPSFINGLCQLPGVDAPAGSVRAGLSALVAREFGRALHCSAAPVNIARQKSTPTRSP